MLCPWHEALRSYLTKCPSSAIVIHLRSEFIMTFIHRILEALLAALDNFARADADRREFEHTAFTI